MTENQLRLHFSPFHQYATFIFYDDVPVIISDQQSVLRFDLLLQTLTDFKGDVMIAGDQNSNVMNIE